MASSPPDPLPEVPDETTPTSEVPAEEPSPQETRQPIPAPPEYTEKPTGSSPVGRRPTRKLSAEDEVVADLASRLGGVNAEKGKVPITDPTSLRYRVWLALICLLSFYSTSEISFSIAFANEFSSFHPLAALNYVIDIFFLFNVMLHFRTGYIEHGEKVLDGKSIVRHYTHSVQGILEIIACIPVDIIQAGIGHTPFVRVNKLLRLYSIPAQLRLLQQTSVTPRVIELVTVVRMGLLWLVITHSCACARILFAADAGYGADEWQLEISLKNESRTTQYLQSLHWCMGLMTGMADGSLPLTTAQFYFTVFIMTAGVFLFAYTVGAIGSLDDNRMNRATVLQTQVTRMTVTNWPQHRPVSLAERQQSSPSRSFRPPPSRVPTPTLAFRAHASVHIKTGTTIVACVGERNAALSGSLPSPNISHRVRHKLL